MSNKTAVIYYSMSGNCEAAAETIARNCGADLIRLEPMKSYPDSGFRKFFWGGKAAIMSETPELKRYRFNSEDYDCVILGFPVWAGNPAPPIRTFIQDNADGLRTKRISAFACQSGSGAEKALAKLKSMLNIESFQSELILIDPKDKPDPDNDRKIMAFCEKI